MVSAIRTSVPLQATFAVALAISCACCAGPGTERPRDEPPGSGSIAPLGPATTGPATSADPTPAESPATDGPFTLLFRDDFTSLDASRWQLMTHSWGGNLAKFSGQAATVENDTLVLRLLPAPDGTVDGGETKPYLGAEVRSRDTLTYGRVRARAKLAAGSAVVSALVTIYTPWPADDWNELDIECLGADPNRVQFNAQVYTGPPTTAPVTTPVSPTQDPHFEALGFDASADFHEYTIEWTPEAATFWLDGELRHTWTSEIDRMKLPQNVLLTLWASGNPGWAGAVSEQTVGASAVYDWVELWSYDEALASAPTPAGPPPPAGSTSVAVQPIAAPGSGGAGVEGGLAPNDAPLAGSPSGGGAPGMNEPVGSAGGSPVGAGAGGDPGAASGGQSHTGGAGGGASDGDPFVLRFRDDFDTLDGSRWQAMTHSWDTNLALFSSESVAIVDGKLELTLLPAPSGTIDDTGAAKSFLGAEVRSLDTIDYGRVRARMRLAKGSAVVSSLVTIYTPWPADDWNELDIEALGADPTHVQFNAMVHTGPRPAAPVTTSVSPTQYPRLVELGFDGSADYHVYTIEWTPERARFLVDDVEKHTWSEQIERMGLPQNVLLTLWASSSADWAGPVTADTAGATASYDWVEVYEYRN